MFVEKFPEIDKEKMIDKHSEKIAELDPLILELKNYLKAKSNVGPLQSELDALLTRTKDSTYGSFGEKLGEIQLCRSIIARYEEQNHVGEDDGIEKIKATLAELEKEYTNHTALKNQLEGNSDEYFYIKN